MGTDIDLVITWVDGNDLEYKKRLQRYTRKNPEAKRIDIAGTTRFANVGEIFYCVASVNRFMKFVRKIYIITDDQDPKLENFLSHHFKKSIPIEIISHKIIFQGYEEYLPTFNSRSIESMLWRIPGLSENFIYMNDDFMTIAPCSIEDFFINDKVICQAKLKFSITTRLSRIIKAKKEGYDSASYKRAIINALKIMGGGSRYLLLSHAPRALKKSFFEKFYSEHPDILIRNLQYKFRDPKQYNPQELFYLNEYREGRCIVIPPKRQTIYLMPKRSGKYITRKLQRFDKMKNAKYCCLNSLDMGDENDIRTILEWMRKRLLLES